MNKFCLLCIYFEQGVTERYWHCLNVSTLILHFMSSIATKIIAKIMNQNIKFVSSFDVIRNSAKNNLAIVAVDRPC